MSGGDKVGDVGKNFHFDLHRMNSIPCCWATEFVRHVRRGCDYH